MAPGGSEQDYFLAVDNLKKICKNTALLKKAGRDPIVHSFILSVARTGNKELASKLQESSKVCSSVVAQRRSYRGSGTRREKRAASEVSLDEDEEALGIRFEKRLRQQVEEDEDAIIAKRLKRFDASDQTYEQEASIFRGRAIDLQILRDEYNRCYPGEVSDIAMNDVLSQQRWMALQRGATALKGHLAGRPFGKPGNCIELPEIWKIARITHTMDAIDCMSGDSTHMEIFKACAQMRLCALIQYRAATSMLDNVGNINRVSDQLKVIDYLVKSECSEACEKTIKKVTEKTVRDYRKGLEWTSICRYMDGPGALLLFLTAGISAWKLTSKWTKAQRKCFKYFSAYLVTTRKQIQLMGQECLEIFCRTGNLPTGMMARLQNVGSPAHEDVVDLTNKTAHDSDSDGTNGEETEDENED